MNTNDAQLEELLTSLATLTEYNQELQQQLIEQSKASEQQIQALTQLIAQMTTQLEEYQAKEQELRKATTTAVQNSIYQSFSKLEESYQHRIESAHNAHIDKAASNLAHISTKLETQLSKLSEDAQKTSIEFQRRECALNSYESAYKAHSDVLERKIGQTLGNVTKNATEALESLGESFTSKLSTKLMIITGGLTLATMLSIALLTWLIMPTGAEIAERRGQYEALKKAQLLEKVQAYDGKYYGRIDRTDCYEDAQIVFGNKTYCRFD